MLKISIKEYMKERQVSRQTIYNRIEKGLLETVKEGNKIYIVNEFENSSKSSETDNFKFNFNEMKEYLEFIQNSYEILKNFDYNFLRARLSSIEKALVDFKIDGGKSDEILIQKVQSFTENINKKLENIEERIASLEAKIKDCPENDPETVKEKTSEEISFEKDLSLSDINEKIERSNEKIEEIIKRIDGNKKALNLFKR